MKLFRLDRKLGWPEVLSAAALLISLANVWYTRAQLTLGLPDVQIEELPTIHTFADPSPDRKTRSILLIKPFLIVNRGGRTVSLVKLDKGSHPLLLQGAIKDGRASFFERADLVVEMASLEASPNHLSELIAGSASAKFEPLRLPFIVNESVDSGKSRTLVLAFRVKDKAGNLVENSGQLFSVQAVFSDEKKYEVSSGFGVE